MKSNRPINLPLSQVIAVNSKSPIAMASILHRVSGIVLFLLVPVMLYILQTSLSSAEGFAAVFDNIILKLVAWVFVAATAYHFVMGVKHLLADAGMNEEFNSGRMAAIISFVIAAVLIVASFIWVVL